MSAIGQTFTGGYGATNPASQIVGPAVPVSSNDVLAEQGGGDLASIGPHPTGVECSQRDDPPGRTTFGRKQKMWKTP